MISLQLADEWLNAWNPHDLTLILSHYEEDFEMSSPMIISAMGEPSDTLKDKANTAEYWKKAEVKYPNLCFEMRHLLRGANSITIVYKGSRGLSAEVFHLNDEGKVKGYQQGADE
jgi:hypothetical protein